MSQIRNSLISASHAIDLRSFLYITPSCLVIYDLLSVKDRKVKSRQKRLPPDRTVGQ